MANKPFNTYFDQRPDVSTSAEYLLGKTSADATVKVYPTGRSSVLYPGVHFSLPAGYGAGTAAAINAAMAAASANGGGEVYLPPETITLDATIDNKYDRVLLKAAGGGGQIHSAAGATYGCQFVPTFAGTVLKHRSPYAAETGGVAGPKFRGGGFEFISVIGNAVATRLLEVDSVNGGIYDLYLGGCVGTYAALFKTGVTSTDLGEACDIQLMEKCFLRIRQLDAGAAQNCGGVKWEGSSNANVSLNFNIMFDIQHYNGHAFEAQSGDNCFISMRAYNPGGTGEAFIGRGPTASVPVGFEDNSFFYLSHNTTVRTEGTDTAGVTAGVNNRVVHLDTANGSAVPTGGTGSDWKVYASDGREFGNKFIRGVFAESTSEADIEALLAAIGNYTVVIKNGSEAHALLTDGTNQWAMRLASGNLSFTRIAGTGLVDLGSTATRMGHLSLTDGITAPSAATGRALFYVDTADGDAKAIFADGVVKRIATDVADYAAVATDADFTLTVSSSSKYTRHTGTLTADRAVTLSTTNAMAGDTFKITRTGGGAFNLNVGTGPLKALATNTWCEVTYNGSAWYLSAYGAL